MKNDTAEDQARAQCASIAEMVAALDVDYDRLEELRGMEGERDEEEIKELEELEEAAGDCESEEDARQRIEEDALSVEVRSDWCNPGEKMTAGEFRIVLCTGGPHVEIVGELSQHGEPESVRILYKDWGTHGELFDFDRAAVLRYCQCFYFGE